MIPTARSRARGSKRKPSKAKSLRGRKANWFELVKLEFIEQLDRTVGANFVRPLIGKRVVEDADPYEDV